MSDLVLVTGISGFLGGHIALQLLKSGYRVRGSLRNLNKSDHVRKVMASHGADVSQLEFCELDLLSDDGWDAAAKGARYMQHVASPFVIQQPKDKMELIRPAVEGTERALEAALASNVEKIVLTSSTAAVMYGHHLDHPQPFKADDWTNLNGRDVTAYVESKTLAERRAWDIMDAANRRSDLVVINPAAIFGPLLDEDPGTSATLVKRMVDGSIPAAPRISLDVVDVRDVAQLHINAMTAKDAGGNRFPISTGSHWLSSMAKGLAERFPQFASRIPKHTAPKPILRIIALFDRDIRDNLGEVGVLKTLDASEARILLGRKFISAQTALDATMESLIAQKLV